MSVIDAIVCAIDKAISNKVVPNTNALIGGISTKIQTEIDGIKYTVPCKRGTEQILVPNDNYSFISYHNLEGIKPATNTKDGYGDEPMLTNTYTNSMVIFGNQKALDITVEELALHIQCVLPSYIKTNSKILTGGAVKVLEISFDVLQLHQIEYPKVEFRLHADHFLMKIRYTFESEVEIQCFNNCN
jgi:hypothetical protein